MATVNGSPILRDMDDFVQENCALNRYSGRLDSE